MYILKEPFLKKFQNEYKGRFFCCELRFPHKRSQPMCALTKIKQEVGHLLLPSPGGSERPRARTLMPPPQVTAAPFPSGGRGHSSSQLSREGFLYAKGKGRRTSQGVGRDSWFVFYFTFSRALIRNLFLASLVFEAITIIISQPKHILLT